MKKIAILGSTGSIGTQTLEVARNNGDLEIVSLAAGSNIRKLEEQIREFHPRTVAVWSEEKAAELRTAVRDLNVRVVSGMDGLIEICTLPEAEIVVTAIVGMIGIVPTIAAMKAGKDIALANKETLVTAGHIIIPLAKETGVKILPVDSEHSAIFQCLNGENRNQLHKILLTASGGPFRTWTKDRIASATAEQALRHPKWSMGSKITIDSATMMNKGLEIIEARWLFDVSPDRINVVVHPQSVIHSMVEFADGAVIAQMGHPDMREPIQYALGYPERLALDNRKLDFAELGSMTFESPDETRFPALALAKEALEKGGNMPCIMNAANEVAVDAFLHGRISFYGMSELVSRCMAGVDFVSHPDLDCIFLTDREAAAKAREILSDMA